ncbi:hypothetical protein BH11CYA1_BH11CYA1_45130 [soil metagenome]
MKTVTLATLIILQSSVVTDNGALAASPKSQTPSANASSPLRSAVKTTQAGALGLTAAVAAYNRGDFTGCVSILDNACRASLSADAQAHYYLANALVKLNRHNEAQYHYEQARRLAPNTPLAQYATSAIATLNASAQLASGSASSATSTNSASSAGKQISGAEAGKQQRAGFISSYNADLQRLTNTQKNRFPYYTQGGGTGESEAFAELFSFAMDPRLLTIEYNRDLANSLPLTFKQVKSVAK